MPLRLSLVCAALALPLAVAACSTEDRPAELGSMSQGTGGKGGESASGGGTAAGGTAAGGANASGGATATGGASATGGQGEGGFAWPLEGSVGKDWIVA